MCGFLGWFRSDPAEAWDETSRAAQARALEAIRHRGPDDGHEVSGTGWWMGFRRLSILDLSEAGRQPMRFGGGRFTLIFNGEIYNFRDLRREVCHRPFASTGDTEVLGAMLERLPAESVLQQLRGMFAFAWWDAEKRELVAARDHFGIKPLYHHTNADGELWLGSELRAVKILTKNGGHVSRRALAQYLRWGSVQAPDTMLEGIESLPPGHLLRWRDGKAEVQRWFTPRWPGAPEWVCGHRAQKELVRETVLRSIEAHLVADVPVGVFLSGGLDSTLMAAGMRHLGQTDVQAFSIGYEAKSGVEDETEAAARTAHFLRCRFVSEKLTAESLAAKLDGYFKHLDQPTGDALNTYLVSRLAAEHVKVTLSGLGADEWFGGYNHHRLALLAARSPLAQGAVGRLTGAALRLAEGFLPEKASGHRAWKMLSYAGGRQGNGAPELHSRGRTIMDPAHVGQLIRGPESEITCWTEDIAARLSLIGELHERAPDSWLHEFLLLETETYLANTLLRDSDVTSMAHSLELRVPLVDREIFALAGRLPPNSKLNLRGGKRMLREAFHDFLPPWIYADRKKKTFTLPLMKWMRHPAWQSRIRDVLSSEKFRSRGWLDARMTQSLVDRYFKSAASGKSVWRMSQTVWMMFVLESWALEHVD